jgi:hypothetical protein
MEFFHSFVRAFLNEWFEVTSINSAFVTLNGRA